VKTATDTRQILDKLEKRRQVIGDFESNICTSYGGLPFKDAEASLRLFAKEVLPRLRELNTEPKTVAAAAE